MSISIKNKLAIKGKLNMGGNSAPPAPPAGDVFGLVVQYTPDDPAVPEPFNLTTPAATPLTIGDSFTNTLVSIADRQVYSVTLTAGTLYSFNVDSVVEGSASSPYYPTNSLMYIYSAEGGATLDFDDYQDNNYSGDYYSPFFTFTPTTTGVYYVGIRSFDNATSGEYNIIVSDTLQPGEADPHPDFILDSLDGALSVQASETGAFTTGTISNAGDRKVYSVDLVQGITYSLVLDGDLANAAAYLYGSLGGAAISVVTVGSSDYNSEGDLSATFDANYSGTYYVGIMGSSDTEVGTFGVMVHT